jgi:chloride channel 7
MTLSLAVIVTEATGDISLGLPIFFSLMTAKFFGDFFNEGLFDAHIMLSGIPLLAWDPPPMTEELNAKHIMSHPVVVLKEVETVSRILDILKTTEHNGFPVVDGFNPDTDSAAETFGQFKGFILRHQLLTIIKRKSFITNEAASSSAQLKPADFHEHYPVYLKISDVHVDDDELGLEVDLRPYMNLAPYSLSENSNLPRIFRLFRGLGLRHIVITDLRNNVIGIVTRIDVAKFKAHVGLKKTTIKELKVYG